MSEDETAAVLEYARVAERLTRERMAHYGYTPEQITAAENPDHSECLWDGNGWDHTNEHETPNHPHADELEDTAEFVCWVLDNLPFTTAPDQTGGV